MNISLTRQSLNDLFPFSLIVDERWIIQAIGRSMKKVLPTLEAQQSVLTTLMLHSPTPLAPSPEALLDESLLFSHPSLPDIRFRGQCLPLLNPSNLFLITLEITVFDFAQLGALGLTLADFRLGDPIFDIALYTQSQKRSTEKLENAKQRLEWEGLAWKTILEITRQTLATEQPLDAYRIALTTVCQFLDWDIGHLYRADSRPQSQTSTPTYLSLVITETIALRGTSKFSVLRPSAGRSQMLLGLDLPELAVAQQEVVWIQDVLKDPRLRSCELLAHFSELTGVAVPILVSGDVTAVLEFYCERPTRNRESMLQFFRLVAIQLGQVVARQEATRREKMQLAALAQSTKMAVVGEISAGVAHEINNPLHTISLINELLKRFASKGELSLEVLYEQTKKIDSSIRHMSRIVRQLQDFSRDSAKDPFTTVSLQSIIQQAMDLCQARIVNKNIRLELPTISDSIRVRCHPQELTQVLLNLISNAYDAIENLSDRWIALEVTTTTDSLELSITDSGGGLSEETGKKIMTPFFTTKPAGRGTGLGLSISRNIITGLGGDIFVDRSCPNTRFVIKLPKHTTGPSDPSTLSL